RGPGTTTSRRTCSGTRTRRWPARTPSWETTSAPSSTAPRRGGWQTRSSTTRAGSGSSPTWRASGRAGSRREPQAHDHGVVVGRPVRVGRVEGVLGRRLEGRVVVDEVDLVRVHVPHGRAGDLRCQRGAREGVVEVAEPAVEEVRVGVLTDEPR